MDALYGIVFSALHARVDHLLAPPLHLRVLPLHRRKVQHRIASTQRLARRRASTEPNQHPWPTEHDEVSARCDLRLARELRAHGAHAAREHDRLVVATDLSRVARD